MFIIHCKGGRQFAVAGYYEEDRKIKPYHALYVPGKGTTAINTRVMQRSFCRVSREDRWFPVLIQFWSSSYVAYIERDSCEIILPDHVCEYLKGSDNA